MQKPWIVLKFGGTSVARAELWDHIADRARELDGVSDDLAQASRVTCC